MTSRCTKATKSAKPETDKSVGKSRQNCRWFSPVVAEFRKRFPQGAAAEMAYRSGRSTRECERWLAGTGAPQGEALHALQNSDIGDMVWLAMTRGCQQPWAKKLRRQIEITQLLDQQIELDLRLKALQRGDL